ncbi:MAG: DHHA2 domain-containing protein [Candidatus Uhrbacteria bacterium]
MSTPTLITTYVNPDLDGIAGITAYAEFLQKAGQNVVVGTIDKLSDETKYVLHRFGFEYPMSISNSNGFDEVILVDTSDLNGLEGKIAPEKVIEIIDHRKVHETEKFPNAKKVQIELVGAAATLVAEKFMERRMEISEKSAILICTAIISNTHNFKGSVTTDRDRKAFDWLNQFAKLPENLWREMFLAKSDLSGDKLAETIRKEFAWFVMGDKKVGIAQLEVLEAKKLLEERGTEILQILEQTKKDMELDLIFQNTVAIEEEKNYFVTDDEQMQKLLEKVFEIEFIGSVAEKTGLVMRKQIVPLLKVELE